MHLLSPKICTCRLTPLSTRLSLAIQSLRRHTGKLCDSLVSRIADLCNSTHQHCAAHRLSPLPADSDCLDAERRETETINTHTYTHTMHCVQLVKCINAHGRQTYNVLDKNHMVLQQTSILANNYGNMVNSAGITIWVGHWCCIGS